MNHFWKSRIFLFLFTFSATFLVAQPSYEIEFQIDNYSHEELLIGYYYGDKTLIKDTLSRNENDRFVLSGHDTIAPGVYLCLTLPDNDYFQFFITEKEAFFNVHANTEKLDQPIFENAPDNELFYDYMGFLNKKRPEAEFINKQLQVEDLDEKEVSSLKDQLAAINEQVEDKQMTLVAQHPNTLSALIVRANLTIKIPEFEGNSDSVQMRRYLYYKSHYFDHFDIENPVSLFTPLIHQRITYYMEKLTPMHPDSIIRSVDYILSEVRPASETFRFYLSHFLNYYAKSTFVGFDAIYVHIAEKYYGHGDADWVSEENLTKILSNAQRLKPLLIGRTAPDFTVYTQENKPLTLSQIEAEYIVLLFWAPDCGHCEKAIPHIIEFEKKYRDRGVQLVSICNKVGKNYDECWESVKEKGMESLLNVGDQYHKSRILSKYYIKNTPMIFILDKERKIILKKIAAEKLEESMENIIENKGKLF